VASATACCAQGGRLRGNIHVAIISNTGIDERERIMTFVVEKLFLRDPQVERPCCMWNLPTGFKNNVVTVGWMDPMNKN